MNSFHENISEELLARYLAESVTENERKEVQNWLAQSPVHEQEFNAYKIIWDESGASLRKKTGVDTDAAWEKVKSKMNKQSINSSSQINVKPFKQTDSGKIIQHKLPVMLWAAAVISLLVIAYGWFLIRSGDNSQSLQLATTNNTIEKKLPDGTKVFLNYNSTLTYPATFTGDLRTVSLHGEAFFDVKPDSLHPFIINANGTEIKVVGTSFNVKAYAKETVRVDVSTGKVLVQKANKKIYLVKGQSAEVVEDTVRSIIPDMNILGYRTQIFDFNAANLNDVVASIRNGYHIDLRLANARIAQCRLTIRFEKEPVDATLSVIAETMGLKVRKEGEVYWFDGKECR